MKKKLGLLALFLSALVVHDFFRIDFIKLGPLTLTYQRLIIIIMFPIVFLPKFRINKKDNVLIMFLLFSIYGVTRISGNYREFITIYFPLISFLFVYILVKDDYQIKFCINFVSLIFIFFCFVGLFEIVTGFHFGDTRLNGETKKLIAFGMYYNENDFSAFLTTMVFFMLLSRFSIMTKIISTSIVLLIVYLNKSQICLLALISYAFIYFFIRLDNKRDRLFVVLVLLIPLFLLRGLFIRILSKSSFYWRLIMYRTGIQVCKNNLIFGTGIGNYESAMFSLGFQTFSSLSANPHCIFLELSGEFGFIWTLLLVVLLIRLFLFIYKSRFKAKPVLIGMVFIYPFLGFASSSCLEKNYTYLALLIPLLLYKRKRILGYKEKA